MHPLQLLHQAKMAAFNLLVHHRLDLPTAIGIETSTACNRRCGYCPQSVAPKKQQIITHDTWQLFLERLREYRWRGAVAPTKYNEFALVPDSARYIAALRALGCRPIVFTNGDKPDVIAQWLDAGVFRVRVTEHPPFKPGWAERLEPIRRRHPLKVRVRRLKYLHNQAGRVDIGDKFDRCFQAHGISVNIDGTVSMCCLDYDSTHLVGDIRTQTLDAIWRSDAHRRVRTLVVRGIPATKLCESCLVGQRVPPVIPGFQPQAASGTTV